MSQNGCLIGFPNRVDESSVTGGSYVAQLPVTNLKNRLLGKVARTTNTAESSTTFTVDLGAAKVVKIVSIVNHNMSLDAQWRVRCTDETSTTNHMKWSEDVSYWGSGGITKVLNITTAPTGFITADKIVASDISQEHTVYNTTDTLPAGRYTMSVYVKSSGYTKVSLAQPTNDSVAATYDLNTRECLVYAGTGAEASMQWVGDGWFRLSLSYTTKSSYPHNLSFHILGSVGTRSFQGDGVNGVFVWGAQVELGTSASSYYPTNASVSVRPSGYMDNWQGYLYDSQYVPVWQAVYSTGEMDWEEDNYWLGTYNQEQIDGYTPTVVHLIPEVVLGRTWRVDIKDVGNTDGFVQFGRVFIGPAWTPEYDAETGLSIGWESATTVQTALSGTKYFQRRTPYRVTKFTLNCLSVDEAMQKAFELDRMAGIDKEVFWVQAQEDSLHALRRRFLGTLREMSPVEFPYAHLGRKGYTIEEVV